MDKTPAISVIIPALNEARGIGRTLRSVLTEEVEVIVVDGGSRDATRAIAREMGAVVLQSQCGRGVQMNAGAGQARGEILLFVHGDTELPLNYGELLFDCLNQPGVAAGGFRLRLSGRKRGLSLVAWGANMRSRWLGMVYGDQGIFLPRRLFLACGGYADVPIMEDFMLVRSLKKKGRIGLARGAVHSDGRRWERRGVVFTTLLNQIIILGFALGLSPYFLAKVYGVHKKV